MGTSGFWSFYSKLVKTINISQLRGKIVYVDVILYLHKYIIGIRKSGRNIQNKKGKVVNHIYALSKIIKNLTDQNIMPICVFDGKSPILKEESIENKIGRAHV